MRASLRLHQQLSVVVVVPQPICVCDLNQLTNCSIQFSSRFYVSGEMTSVLNLFKLLCQSKKLKESSQVTNLVSKMHTKISWKNIYDLVPKGAQEKRTEVLENKVDRM